VAVRLLHAAYVGGERHRFGPYPFEALDGLPDVTRLGEVRVPSRSSVGT
jgi:hypothetical protein